MTKKNKYVLGSLFSVGLIILYLFLRAADHKPLDFKLYLPQHLPSGAALVVFLHGCGQELNELEDNVGWRKMADEFHFALLLPYQHRQNNPMRCFNWFDPHHNQRDQGELHQIIVAVQKTVKEQKINPRRVFIAGFSAGGAMTAQALAVYPEVFVAGAIFAGVPAGCASNGKEGFECMQMKNKNRSAAEWGDLVRDISHYHGPWPRVSVWQGSEDETVVPATATELVKQRTNVHGSQQSDISHTALRSVEHRVYKNGQGRAVVESWQLRGMAHAIPIHPGSERDQCGSPSTYAFPSGVCSARALVQFFGI